MDTKWIVVVVVLTLTVSCVAVYSPFRFKGGTIQWRPLDAQNFNRMIEISQRFAWQKSLPSTHNENYMCVESDIGTTTQFGANDDIILCQEAPNRISFAPQCDGQPVNTTNVYCTDFDYIEDWMSGERKYDIELDVTVFEIEYQLQNRQLRMMGNLTRRSYNDRVNSSPVTTTTPVYSLQHNCIHNISIPVRDADQDIVRCRLESECGSGCGEVPGVMIDEETCVLTVDASLTDHTEFYAVALQIEDFMTPLDTTPMSSVPLQFIIEVVERSESCTGGIRPFLDPETPPDGACIPVPFGTNYTAGIVANSGDESVKIIHFLTSSPFGLVRSPVTKGPNTLYYSNVTWTPSSGLHLFCFRAVNSQRYETEDSCITLLGGVTGPSAQSSSVSPTGTFTPTASTIWNITFDQAITRPSSSRYIRFYETSGQNVYKFDVTSSSASYPASGSGNRTLTFTFSPSFTAGLSHYVLLDRGVAFGSEFCTNQESLAVMDTTFWTFTVAETATVEEEAKVEEECAISIIFAAVGWFLFLMASILAVVVIMILLLSRPKHQHQNLKKQDQQINERHDETETADHGDLHTEAQSFRLVHKDDPTSNNGQV